MSNKNILQNHNERLTTNNISIDELITSIENLPDAGTGASEDLSAEFEAYETNLSTQETTIDNIINALQDKADNSKKVEELLTHTITKYLNNTLTSIGDYAFYGCKALTELVLPNLVTCGAYSFYRAGLTILSLPELTNSSTCTFAGMEKLTTLILPKVTLIGNSAVKDCSYLTFADIGMSTKIDLLAFNNCGRLDTVIIRTGSVCQLQNVSAFNNTGISKGTGYVYVPDDLVEDYKIATNWSTYANQIKPLSELEG